MRGLGPRAFFWGTYFFEFVLILHRPPFWRRRFFWIMIPDSTMHKQGNEKLQWKRVCLGHEPGTFLGSDSHCQFEIMTSLQCRIFCFPSRFWKSSCFPSRFGKGSKTQESLKSRRVLAAYYLEQYFGGPIQLPPMGGRNLSWFPIWAIPSAY